MIQDKQKMPKISFHSKRLYVTYQNVLGVGNSGNNSGSNHNLFPGLCDVDNVNSLIVTFINVWSHQAGAVLSTNMSLNHD